MVFIAFSEHNNIDKTNILFSGSLINTWDNSNEQHITYQISSMKLIQCKFTKVIVFVSAVEIQLHYSTRYPDDRFICSTKEA